MKAIFRIIKIFFGVLLIFISTHKANASVDLKEVFEKANISYKEAQYYDAIELYLQILESNNHNFETYYNLANAYYKLNQFPEAIYYYEKAYQISPLNKDLAHNLRLANSALTFTEQKIPDAFHVRFINSVMRMFSPNLWATISILLLIMSLVSIFLFLFLANQKIKRLFFVGSLVMLFFTVSSVFFGQRYVYHIKNPTHGIIMISSGAVKSSPDMTGSDVYVVNAGMKVRVLSQLGDWYEIQVAEGNKGWVEASSLRLI